MYVPRDLLREVYAFVAERQSMASAPPPSAAEDGSGWSDEMLTELYFESSEGMRSILRVLAERPGEWLTSAELAARMPSPNGRDPADWNNVAGTLGAFQRRCNRYGLEKPFTVRQDGGTGRYLNRMAEDIAESIRRAAHTLDEAIDQAKRRSPE